MGMAVRKRTGLFFKWLYGQLTSEVSLRFRIFLSAFLIILTVSVSFLVNYSFQRDQALIIQDTLATRVDAMEIAQGIKESLVLHNNAVYHYAATRSAKDLVDLRELRKKINMQLEQLSMTTTNPTIRGQLNELKKRTQKHMREAGEVIEFARSNQLPEDPGLFQAGVRAAADGKKYTTFEFLSSAGEVRLQRLFALCDEIVTYHRAQFDNAVLETNELLDRSGHVGGLVVVVACGFVLLIMSGLAISIVGPIHDLLMGVREIEKGRLDVELPVLNATEIGRLTHAFNRMAHTIRGQRERLQHEAITDGLTGAYNQRHFGRRLEQEFERVKRTGEPLSLMMIDVDHFKAFNDTNGHELGNAMLRRISQTIRENIRHIDLLFRYGGDEFVVILPNADGGEARPIAERLIQAVRATAVPGLKLPGIGKVTLSIGGASYPQNALTKEDLVLRADQTLYEMKSAGRNGFQWCQAMVAEESKA